MSENKESKLSMTEIMKVQSEANRKIDALFYDMGWQRTHRITEGDVRVVLETYLALSKNESSENK